MVSFAAQKLLSLIRSHSFIFVFILITLGGESKKILLQFMSKSVLPMFSFKSFIAPGLTLSKSEREKQIPYINACMWNLKKFV